MTLGKGRKGGERQSGGGGGGEAGREERGRGKKLRGAGGMTGKGSEGAKGVGQNT